MLVFRTPRGVRECHRLVEPIDLLVWPIAGLECGRVHEWFERRSRLTLRLGRCEESVEIIMQRALVSVGLPTEILAGNARSGPALRMSGRRRLARLAEIIGDPPPIAPDGAWP